MNSRLLAAAPMIAGTVLLLSGVEASRALLDFSNLKSVLLICSGILAIVFGGSFLCRIK